LLTAFALLALVAGGISALNSSVDARTNNNWASTERSQRCSREARQHADRNARRRTATGAATGAAIGGIAGGSRRNAGRGALIGGGAGLLTSNSRWQSLYNRRYHECINR
jgi:hypothetical protein